ncbi:VanZ family protein [Paucisalibacillus sp. EB02]|uniref:VanZ family protein n=1 Tax=Paucisalibacillus sp. EB02 TaxID=1347087 RepID=UPI0004AD6974|nr:VanZ family protein [Paucisalibacillus sp. EB02]
MKYINDIPIFIIFITLVCYVPIRILYIKNKNLDIRVSREITFIVLITYAESLLYLTLFPTASAPSNTISINLIPFQTIDLYLNYHGNVTLQIINLLGNVVVFMPIGIFAPLLLTKITFMKILFIGFCSTLFIETMQLILSINGVVSRSFDVDDLLLNTVGVLSGFVFWLIFHKLFQNMIKSRS